MFNRDLVRALDPDEFASDCGLELDPWQSRVMSSTARKVLLNCCRQSGKSTVTALLALHGAVYDPGLYLVFSPTQRQSTELLLKVKEHLRNLSDPPEVSLESVTRLEFRNTSRIISLPGSEATVRGFSAARAVIVDEAARTPDDLMAAVRPILATSGGRLIALSSPAGRRGWFWQADTLGEGWQKYRITADQCPRISPAFLADEMRELGPLRYAAEYECQYVDDETQVFSSELIDAAFRDDIPPLWSLS
jgi:hypothetical protein